MLGDAPEAEPETYTVRGFPVVVWTVNRAETIAHLLRLGVAGIITDDPGLAAERRRLGAWSPKPDAGRHPGGAERAQYLGAAPARFELPHRRAPMAQGIRRQGAVA